MFNSGLKEDEIMEVDLHKMQPWEAENYLDYCLNNAPKKVKEVIVIHGYRGGKILLDMVRKTYKHKRIEKKFLSLNNGVTNFKLK